MTWVRTIMSYSWDTAKHMDRETEDGSVANEKSHVCARWRHVLELDILSSAVKWNSPPQSSIILGWFYRKKAMGSEIEMSKNCYENLNHFYTHWYSPKMILLMVEMHYTKMFNEWFSLCLYWLICCAALYFLWKVIKRWPKMIQELKIHI